MRHSAADTHRAVDGLVARRSNEGHGSSQWDGQTQEGVSQELIYVGVLILYK